MSCLPIGQKKLRRSRLARAVKMSMSQSLAGLLEPQVHAALYLQSFAFTDAGVVPQPQGREVGSSHWVCLHMTVSGLLWSSTLTHCPRTAWQRSSIVSLLAIFLVLPRARSSTVQVIFLSIAPVSYISQLDIKVPCRSAFTLCRSPQSSHLF